MAVTNLTVNPILPSERLQPSRDSVSKNFADFEAKMIESYQRAGRASVGFFFARATMVPDKHKTSQRSAILFQAIGYYFESQSESELEGTDLLILDNNTYFPVPFLQTYL